MENNHWLMLSEKAVKKPLEEDKQILLDYLKNYLTMKLEKNIKRNFVEGKVKGVSQKCT